MSKGREFLWRRLHSLLGVIPVGLFLVFHLTLNFTSVGGEDVYNDSISVMDLLPHAVLTAMEWIIIYIPMLFHAFYGIYIAFTATNNTNRFSTYRNWAFKIQRYTGVFLVIFIAWHIFQTRVQKAFGESVEWNMVAEIVDNPWMLAFYIVGILSATFHLSNGLWTFLVSWGIIQSPKSQRIASYITNIFFILLSIVGVIAIVMFAI